MCVRAIRGSFASADKQKRWERFVVATIAVMLTVILAVQPLGTVAYAEDVDQQSDSTSEQTQTQSSTDNDASNDGEISDDQSLGAAPEDSTSESDNDTGEPAGESTGNQPEAGSTSANDGDAVVLAAGSNTWTSSQSGFWPFGYYTGTLSVGQHYLVDGTDSLGTTTTTFDTSRITGTPQSANVSDIALEGDTFVFDHAEYNGSTIQSLRINDNGDLQYRTSQNGNWQTVSNVDGLTFYYQQSVQVNWYVNGQIVKTDNVALGDQPSYDGRPPDRNFGQVSDREISFAGWATEPNSKNYMSEDELPAVEGSINYYAVFTADTYFYFLLPGTSNTSTDPTDYMYAGEGVVIVPDSFSANGERWYSPAHPLGDYVVQEPSDEAIRLGLAAYYDGSDGRDQYDESWQYTIDWVTLTVGNTSVGYDYETINRGYSVHLDCSLTLQTEDQVTAMYNVAMPDGTTLAQSQTHDMNTELAVNSTVSTTGQFTTDGYTYDGVMEYNGVNYVFDGWYTDPAYTQKAADSVQLGEESQTFYGRYVAEKYGEVGYNLALDGASWNGDTPDGLVYHRTTDAGGEIYIENNKFVNGDQFTVRGDEPVAENYAFIGWFDKDRTDTEGGQAATFRSVGDQLTYIYDGTTSDADDEYTLDAVWAQLTAEGGTYVYDGTSHAIVADSQYTTQLKPEYIDQIESSGLVDFGTIQYQWTADNPNSADAVWSDWSTTNPTFTDAGTYTVRVQQTINDTTLTNQAQVVIQPREVIVTAGSDEKDYDGTPLTCNSWTVAEPTEGGEGVDPTGLVGNDQIANVTVTGSQTYPGSSNNVASNAVFADGVNDKNYIVAYVNGTLTVNNRDAKYAISATAPDGHYTYDGTEKAATGVTFDQLIFNDQTYTVEGLTSEQRQTDAGTYTTSISGNAVVKDAAGQDVTAQFFVDTTDTGTLQIDPAPLTVTTESATKEYDGTPLTADGSIEGLVNNETVGFTTTGSQTEVGSSTNTYSIAWADEDSAYTAKSSNYSIVSEDLGTLTVTEAPESEDPGTTPGDNEGTTGDGDGSNNGSDNGATSEENAADNLPRTSDVIMPGVVGAVGLAALAAAIVAVIAWMKNRRPNERHMK